MTLFRPPPEKDSGTAILVFPGGGYHILAMDLEGTEVCDWLNSIGVTGILLKYRVPKRDGLEKHTVAFQDAQRALELLRSRPDDYPFSTLGVLGFSAGGHLAASASTAFALSTNTNAALLRPDFAVLIYPGYLVDPERSGQLAPDLWVSSNTPPTFIAMTQDDPVRVENALVYASALQAAKVPMELHLYTEGGHGYGLRRTDLPVTSWPDRLEAWLRSRGWLSPKPKANH